MRNRDCRQGLDLLSMRDGDGRAEDRPAAATQGTRTVAIDCRGGPDRGHRRVHRPDLAARFFPNGRMGDCCGAHRACGLATAADVTRAAPTAEKVAMPP